MSGWVWRQFELIIRLNYINLDADWLHCITRLEVFCREGAVESLLTSLFYSLKWPLMPILVLY